MLVVTVVTALGLFFAQRNVADNARRELEQSFQRELASFHSLQEIRHTALAERSRTLARRPRIHAALEDNALDLLYPSARDELLDVIGDPDQEASESEALAFNARFYRFLDNHGAVIPPPNTQGVGPLRPEEEARLGLRAVPDRAQTGYLVRSNHVSGDVIDEIIAMPIISSETGRPVAALVLGFKPIELSVRNIPAGILTGIWTQGHLSLPGVNTADRAALARKLSGALAAGDRRQTSLPAVIAGQPCLLFQQRLNPGSPFDPAYEVCIYPLTESQARQRRLLWQFSGAGGVLLMGAFVASHYLSQRLSSPVERIVVDSEQNRHMRRKAEAALELTHEELQRSARFSAAASHQLKTPVTVLRAGLEELLAQEPLSAPAREEISGLVHQTFRLTNLIEDLLLLSRMDAGRLQLQFSPIDLAPLIEGWLDDLGALPDSLALAVETDFPSPLLVEGEQRYTTLVLQNLLENARKYNRPGGRIRVSTQASADWIVLTIGNTGTTIPAADQPNVFQRFHRSALGENVPGHGLGLNLAMELTRLHRGELRLVSSVDDWTEFEVRFRASRRGSTGGGVSA